ncbi:glycoside hydrolase family 71 protein [Hypoxylon cercidicola]|nr:glycoside hydrolase family 71 protein [Hypoxylon cercidicola]
MYGKANSALAWLLAGSAFLTQSIVESKLVFAHYMVGTVDPNTKHAQQDIDGAINVGFDAFALNVGNPGADWASNTVQQLFDYAETRPFKLFFSFDFYGNGDINQHQALFARFKDHPAHLKYGSNNLPVVSSYSGGSIGPDAWRNFKTTNNVYLIPNPEADGNYYSNPSRFFQSWGDAVDGVFSWETAWPDTSDTPVNVSSARDEAVKAAADAAGKTYVMGLSSLQYKHCCGDSWYRAGETNLPERMEQILSVSPEFAEVITWNDAGESHYIGPCWAEGLTPEILQYGNSDTMPHDGWQGVIGSFVDAFKAGAGAGAAMRPRNGRFAGALWHRGVLTSSSSSCGGDRPRGAGAAVDAVNYAVVLPAGSSSAGLRVRVTSGGRVLATRAVGAGLGYGSVAGMRPGPQKVELVDGAGNVVASASGAVDVGAAPTDGFCNYNYYVAGLQ